MKRVVICHAGKVKDNALLASARIVRYLAERFDADIADDPASMHEADVRHYPYEFCIVVSSAFNFSTAEMRDSLGSLVARSGTYVFVQNDYMTEPSGQIGTAFKALDKAHSRVVWSTIPKRLEAERADKRRSTYVNWNMLTYQPQPEFLFKREPAALFYYGAHRRERVKYFQAWLGDQHYQNNISTSTRVEKKWRETLGTLGATCSIYPQMDNAITCMGALGTFGLYIEDEHSHKHYTSPANRFYEMLSAGIPMLFDRSVKATFEAAGYDWQKFRRFCPAIGQSPAEFARVAVRDFDPAACAEQQRDLWARDYRAELDEQVAKAAAKINLE